MTLIKLSVFTSLFIGISAQAKIPTEFFKMGAGDCVQQQVASQNSDGVVQVVDGRRCHSLYGDAQVIEVVVDDISYKKQIYVYDRAETYEFERAVTVRLVNERYKFDFQDGAALYLGKTPEGRDRFLVCLVSVFRPTPAMPIDLYVKMGNNQYETTSVTLTP